MQLKLQVVLIPVGDTRSPVAGMAVRKFLHLANPSAPLSEVCDALLTRYHKLYPDSEPLELDGIQDNDCCDLDPDFSAGEIFVSGDVLRVLVRNSFSSLSRDVSGVFPSGILDVSNASVKRGASPDLSADISQAQKRARTIWAARQTSTNTSIISGTTADAVSPVHLPPPQATPRGNTAKITPHKRASPSPQTGAASGRRITSGMLVLPESAGSGNGRIFSDNDDSDADADPNGSFSQVAKPSNAVSRRIRETATVNDTNSDADVTVVPTTVSGVGSGPIEVSSPSPEPPSSGSNSVLPSKSVKSVQSASVTPSKSVPPSQPVLPSQSVQKLPQPGAATTNPAAASKVSLPPPAEPLGITPSKTTSYGPVHLATSTPQHPNSQSIRVQKTAVWPRAMPVSDTGTLPGSGSATPLTTVPLFSRATQYMHSLNDTPAPGTSATPSAPAIQFHPSRVIQSPQVGSSQVGSYAPSQAAQVALQNYHAYQSQQDENTRKTQIANLQAHEAKKSREAEAEKARQAENDRRVLAARQAKLKADKEEQARKAHQERIEAEKLHQAQEAERAKRIARAKAEEVEMAKKIAQAKAEEVKRAQRIAKAKAEEAERIAKAKAEEVEMAKKIAQAKAEEVERAQRIAKAKAEEAERIAKAKSEEVERIAKTKAEEAERIAKAKAEEVERIAKAKAEEAERNAKAKAEEASRAQLAEEKFHVVGSQPSVPSVATSSVTTRTVPVELPRTNAKEREPSLEPPVVDIDSDSAMETDVFAITSDSPRVSSAPVPPAKSVSEKGVVSKAIPNNGSTRATNASVNREPSTSAVPNDTSRTNLKNSTVGEPSLTKSEVMQAFKFKQGLTITAKIREKLSLPSPSSSLEADNEEEWKNNRAFAEELKNRQNAAKAGANVGDRRTRSRATVNTVPDLETVRANSANEKREREREAKAKQLPIPFSNFASKAKLSSDYIKLQKLDAKIDKRDADRIASSEAVKLEDSPNQLSASNLSKSQQTPIRPAGPTIISGETADRNASSEETGGSTSKTNSPVHKPVEDENMDPGSESDEESGSGSDEESESGSDEESGSGSDEESDNGGNDSKTSPAIIEAGTKNSEVKTHTEDKGALPVKANIAISTNQNNEESGNKESGSEESGSEESGSEESGSEESGSEESGSEESGSEESEGEGEQVSGAPLSEVKNADTNDMEIDEETVVTSQENVTPAATIAADDESSSSSSGSSEDSSEDESSSDESVEKTTHSKIATVPSSSKPNKVASITTRKALRNNKVSPPRGQSNSPEVISVESTSDSDSESEESSEDEQLSASKTHSVSDSIAREKSSTKDSLSKVNSGSKPSIVANSTRKDLASPLKGKEIDVVSSAVKQIPNAEEKRPESSNAKDVRSNTVSAKRVSDSPVSNPSKRLKSDVLDRVIPKSNNIQNIKKSLTDTTAPEKPTVNPGEDSSQKGGVKKPVTDKKGAISQASVLETPTKLNQTSSTNASTPSSFSSGKKSNIGISQSGNSPSLKSSLNVDKNPAASKGVGKHGDGEVKHVLKVVSSDSSSGSSSDSSSSSNSDSISESSSESDSNESIDLSDGNEDQEPSAPSSVVTKTPISRLLPKSYKPTVSKPSSQPALLSQPQKNENSSKTVTPKQATPKQATPKTATPKQATPKAVPKAAPKSTPVNKTKITAPIKKPSLARLTDLSQRGLPEVMDKSVAAGSKPVKPSIRTFGDSSSSSDDHSSSSSDSDSSDSSDSSGDESDGKSKFLSVKDIEKSKSGKKKKKGGFLDLMRDAKKK